MIVDGTTPKMSFRWGPFKPPFGDCAIYSTTSMFRTLHLRDEFLYLFRVPGVGGACRFMTVVEQLRRTTGLTVASPGIPGLGVASPGIPGLGMF